MGGVTHGDVLALKEPTPASEIKQRQGPGGRMLDYIDARYVMDRLDDAIGPGNWQDRYEDRPGGSVRCGIGINIDDEWVWKWDVGDESDIEAVKGAHSDAFKRAGVKWGIGRDLYGDHARASRPPTTARSAPAVAPAPQRPTAVADDPYADLPSDWDAKLPAVEQPRDIRDGFDGDECPEHHRPWRTNSKGYYCSGKMPDGSWCQWKPSKAWAARHETAGVA